MTDQVAADEAQALPSELGIKEARGILGKLVRAAAAEQLTYLGPRSGPCHHHAELLRGWWHGPERGPYLTIKGERIAAIVPAGAARTLAQTQTTATELTALRAEHDQALSAAAGLRHRVESEVLGLGSRQAARQHGQRLRERVARRLADQARSPRTRRPPPRLPPRRPRALLDRRAASRVDPPVAAVAGCR